ncbi:hypothetical protein SAMN03097708_01948 [Thiohalomonas denitrificans]|uniref:Uncharacterized protein n=2 Tax=Thiohalomonas denitrificans TaxID=415747 RepID=A0A1G5QE33_9GAMM|nr:hypothetical protein SAMN03097708_01948 [Thiohalomonas denitrificans]
MVLVLVASPASAVLTPQVELDVTVVDEDGVPVEGVSVRGDFLGVVSGDGHVERQVTDEKGYVKLLGRSFFPVRVKAGKIGYYRSRVEVNTREVVNGKEVFRDREVTIMLREKRNPIPLYAIKYSGEIPVAEEWVGFDLQKADWVSPHGKGVSSDFLFRYEGEFAGINDAHGELKLRYPNEDDGMQQITRLYSNSSFKTPYEAPVSGYSSKAMKWFQAIGYDMDRRLVPNEAKTYFLRIRTISSEEGEIESALYGKLYGDIQYSLRSLRGGVSSIKFMYYLNPTPNDRNLEFAVGENLFKDLKHEQQVREP